MRSIVVGGAGFIGSHLCEALLKRGDDVIAIDSLITGKVENLLTFKEHKKFQFIQKDGADPSLKNELQKADYIYHQAALPSVQRSFEEPILSHEANTTLTLKLLEFVKNSKNLKKFVFASSSSIYGDSPTLPKVETMAPNPLSPYAGQKFLSERYCQIYAQAYNLPTVSLRYFNVFGPRQDPDSVYSAVIPRFIRAAKNGSLITIYGDGKQTRDFTYVENVVSANLIAAERGPAGRFYNIAGGLQISLLDLLELLEKKAGRKLEVRFEQPRVGDIRDSFADMTAARKDLNFQSSISFAEGIKKTWDYF